MTVLTLALRNTLAQDSDLTALLGKSASWDTWIFSEELIGAKVENTQRCLIVISENGTWDSPNQHNTQTFPRLFVDVWADPTRNADLSVQKFDAKDKAQAIIKILNKHLHLMDLSNSNGMPLVWGTAAEVAARTGVVISGSQRLDGPEFSPIRESQGSFMARMTYGVNVV